MFVLFSELCLVFFSRALSVGVLCLCERSIEGMGEGLDSLGRSQTVCCLFSTGSWVVRFPLLCTAVVTWSPTHHTCPLYLLLR